MVELDPAVVELHAGGHESTAHGAGDLAFQRSDVGLLDLVLGVHDVLRELAVVRHEDKTLGIVVETAHVEDALVLVAHDVAQRVAALRVVHGGEHLAGLVQCQSDVVRIDAYARTVYAHLLLMRVNASSELGDQFTVDLDTAFGDHVLALAAGPESRLGKQLLESNGIGIVLRFRSAGICVWHRSPNVAGQILSSQRLSICIHTSELADWNPSQSQPIYHTAT